MKSGMEIRHSLGVSEADFLHGTAARKRGYLDAHWSRLAGERTLAPHPQEGHERHSE